MISIIARKEMTEMMRDGRFRWSSAITLGLLAGALALGWQNYSDVKAQHESAQRATRQQWLSQGQKNPHSAAHYGVYAFKPKMPLSLVDRGVDPYVGVSAWLEAHKQNDFKFKPAQDATAIQRLGELTGATVLQLLIPLLIVLLTFSAFAAEREQGTLRQLLSLGVERSVLAWGKALGIAGSLSLLLIPATTIGVAALALTSENGSMAASWPRFLLMGGAYLLYFAAFIGISLAVSATVKSSRMALIVLLAFWIVNGLVAPRVSGDAAKALYPTPSAIDFARNVEHDIRTGLDGHDTADQRTERLKQRLMKEYNVDSIEKLPLNFAGVAMQEGEEHGNRVFDKHFSTLWQTYDLQQRIHQAAAVMAPVLAVRSISMGAAGTDFAQHAHFATAAEEYRRVINREMNMDIAHNQKDTSAVYMRGGELWSKIPEFSYTAPGTAWVLERQKFSLALLLVWALAGVVGAWISARRLQVN